MRRAVTVKRAIERRVANPLSRRILAGQFKEGETEIVYYGDAEYVFGKKEAPRKREKAAARAG